MAGIPSRHAADEVRRLEPEQLATRSCPPSSLSLLGLVRHMTEVETWFHDFDGRPHGEWYVTDDNPDGEFDLVDPARADADLAHTTPVSTGPARLSKDVTSTGLHRELAGPSRCGGCSST